MTLLVIGAHRDTVLTQATICTLYLCSQWGEPIDLLLNSCSSNSRFDDVSAFQYQCAKIPGVNKLLLRKLLPNNQCPEFSVNQWADTIAPLAKTYRAIVTAHTIDSVALMGVLSAMIHWPLLTDVDQFSNNAYSKYPIRALQKCLEPEGGIWHSVPEHSVLITLRTKRIDFPAKESLLSSPSVETLPEHAPIKEGLQTTELKVLARAQQCLADACIVVSGGRPFGKKFMNALLPLSGALGAAVGATRGAVDAGFAPVSCQVGMTGAHITPDIYLAIGISGSPQHMAGISQTCLLIAINKDSNSPIAKQAHYFLEGDMHKLLPKLMESLQRYRSVRQQSH